MNAYGICKKREYCFSLLLWPDYKKNYEIRWDYSEICKFADYNDMLCILRNVELKTYSKPKTISWDWPSSPSSDAGSNHADCVLKISKNKYYDKINGGKP